MAQLPVLLRPRYLVRRKAMRSGLFGPSLFWRSIAVFILSWNGIKKLFGKQSDTLFIRGVGVGRTLTVAAYAPMTRRDRRRTGTTKASLEAAARADLEAAQSAS